MFFLLDVACGIIATHVVGLVFGFEPTLGHLALGIGLALLPDVDFMVHYLRTRETGAHRDSIADHRDGLHYPLVYIFGGVALLLLFEVTSAKWLIALFLLTSIAHFVHDSIGIGWGVKWLYPFSQKNYKFFSDKEGMGSRKFLVSWTPEERVAATVASGDPEWIKNLFWRPLGRGEISPLLFVEFVLPTIFIVDYALMRLWF